MLTERAAPRPATTPPVRLGASPSAQAPTGDDVVRAAIDEHLPHGRTGGDDPARTTTALQLAVRLGDLLQGPGSGRTVELWEALAEVAARDVGAARTVEPHLDALAILGQLPATERERIAAVGAGPDSTWGVFAAEGQGLRLEAQPAEPGTSPGTGSGSAGDGAGDGAAPTHRLTGGKPWCSLAGTLTHAIVTAHLPGGEGLPGAGARQAFAVDLRHPGVSVAPAGWAGIGLPGVPSGPVHFADVPAVPVGEPGWYLRRPGFACGGIGVAACWYGGAVGVARTLAAQARQRPDLDQIGKMLLGQVDTALFAARTALATAAAVIDGGDIPDDPRRLALRVRAVVADAAETVLRAVGHGTGPAPLAFDAGHAQRVADLELYLRQEHAERDRAALGASLLSAPTGGKASDVAGGELPW